MAAPVASPEAVRSLESLADDVVCVDVPIHLRAVGLSYRDFSAVGEDEVGRLLQSGRWVRIESHQMRQASDRRVVRETRRHRGTALYAANTGHHRVYDEAFLDTLPLRPRDHVLDLGCGSGDFTATVARRVPEGVVVGLEPQPSLLEEARSQALPNQRFIEGRAQEPRVPPAPVAGSSTS